MNMTGYGYPSQSYSCAARELQRTAVFSPGITWTKSLWDWNKLQRNSNCNALSRNKKNQSTAETTDIWKTKSRGISTIMTLSLLTVSIRIISSSVTCNIHPVYFIWINNVTFNVHLVYFIYTNNITCNVHLLYFICTNPSVINK